MLSIEVNEKDLTLKLNSLSENLIDATILNQIAEMAKFFIVNRTQKGLDVSGNSFTRYSETHKMFRESHGYQTGHVDLFMTGQMQASIASQVNVQNKTSTINFSDAQQSAKAHGLHFGSTHRWGSNPKVVLPSRKFFDLSDSEMELITQEVEKMVSEKLL